MDIKLLCKIGLSRPQALAYKALITKNGAKPTTVAKLIGESRANTYAILDRLLELDLAYREDIDKKYVYYAHSPEKLEVLINNRLAEDQRQLQKLRKQMPAMLSSYHESPKRPRVDIKNGRQELVKLYEQQTQQEDRFVRFIKSMHDISFFGYRQMRDIRFLAVQNKKRRLGLTPHVAADKILKDDSDSRTALRRVWLPNNSYTAPVEWVISGDQVQAIIFQEDGYGIAIDHPEIANSLRQIFDLLKSKLDTT